MTRGDIAKFISTETIHRIDYSKFDAIVKSIYGHDFDFAADQECSNDSSHSFVVRKGELDRYSWYRKDLDGFKATGEGSSMTPGLLYDLCDRDLIPEGNYIIDVSW